MQNKTRYVGSQSSCCTLLLEPTNVQEHGFVLPGDTSLVCPYSWVPALYHHFIMLVTVRDIGLVHSWWLAAGG